MAWASTVTQKRAWGGPKMRHKHFRLPTKEDPESAWVDESR